MTKSIKKLMAVTAIIAVTLALTACGSDVPSTSAESTKTTTAEASPAPQATDETTVSLDLPEDLREDLVAIIQALPGDLQQMVVSEFPEELTDDYQDMLGQKLDRIANMDPDDLKQKQSPEGQEGDGSKSSNNRKPGGHHDHESSEAFLNNTRITLDGSKTYTDGTYTGVAEGYEDGLTVEITLKDNQLSAISIIDHRETPGFFEEAFQMVPSDIIDQQSTNVDTVSGATASSEGIIVAVENALAKAEVQ